MNQLKDLTILKYQEINAAIEMNKDSELAQWYNILSLIEGKEKQYYLDMKFKVFTKLISKYSWIVNEQLSTDFVHSFAIGDETFYVEENRLNTTTEQFISLGNLTKDKNTIIENLHKIIAVMTYKVKGESIENSEFERRFNLFQNELSITIGYSIGFFFAVYLAQLSQTTQYYLHRKNQLKEMKQTLFTRNTGGTTQSLN